MLAQRVRDPVTTQRQGTRHYVIVGSSSNVRICRRPCASPIGPPITVGSQSSLAWMSGRADERMISDQPASPRAARLILSDAPHRAVSKIA
jgi:hypothetical protein